MSGGAAVRTRVKVCGITSPEDARLASREGADAVGLVFHEESPRHVDVEQACRIVAALPPLVLRVGVFVDAPAERMVEHAAAVGLDLLQLHGAEPHEALPALPRRVLKAFGVGPGFRVEDVAAYAPHVAGILLDTRSADGRTGGTGRTFDWALAGEVRERVPFLVLAGGLDAHNVAQAIRQVGPDAVDVSSGVESAPGRKDPDKLRSFIQAVRGTS
jgi:phosphoribosylanthranilate isomerase